MLEHPSAPAIEAQQRPAARRAIRRAGLGAALTCALSLAALGLGGVSPALASLNGARFTFSGSLRGTLTISYSACAGASGYGGQFQLYGTLAGLSSSSTSYTVTASTSKKSGGTFTKFPPDQGVAVVLDAEIDGAGYIWIATSGRLTTKGSRGSMDVSFVPETHPLSGKPGKGDVHVSGSWSCAKL
ncbi:MAG TPA: hypothetical protein VMD59_13945 [Acidimicrobiales bacterium]|nr:hypothetical protein [Acidimicrobiales bacterium]